MAREYQEEQNKKKEKENAVSDSADRQFVMKFSVEKKEAGADRPTPGGDQEGDGPEEEGGGAEEEREEKECQPAQPKGGSSCCPCRWCGEVQLASHPHHERPVGGGRGGGGGRDEAGQSRGGGQPAEHEGEPREEEGVAPVRGGQTGGGVARPGRVVRHETVFCIWNKENKFSVVFMSRLFALV